MVTRSKKLILIELQDAVPKKSVSTQTDWTIKEVEEIEVEIELEPESESEPKKSRKRKRRKFLDYYTLEDYDYFMKMSKRRKRKIECLENEILKEEFKPLRFKILNSNMPMKIKTLAIRKLNNLVENGSGSEVHKLTTWIKALSRIPFGVYRDIPVTNASPVNEIQDFIMNVQQSMDKHVYGHTEAKNKIIAVIAKWIMNPSSKGLVLGIGGPPGVGKTTLIKYGISEALNLPLSFISMGGANDSSFLDGHSMTYEGSMHGKIVDCLMQNGCMNPVLCFDEMDKVGMNSRGDEIFNIMMQITDITQNDHFQDKYFQGVNIDLSRSIIISTFNDESLLHPTLRDRMIIIRTKPYTTNDKLKIIKNYILPQIGNQYLINATIRDDALKLLLDRHQKDTGMRAIQHTLEHIIGDYNVQRVIQGSKHNEYVINSGDVDEATKIEIPDTLQHLYL